MSFSHKSLIEYTKKHHHGFILSLSNGFYFFFVLILAVSISLGIYVVLLAQAQTVLPAPNHSLWFTYYLDDSLYGNFRNELGDTINAYLIWHYYMVAGPTALDNSFKDAVARGKNIIFGPDFSPADTTLRPSVDQGLDVAKNYWNNIVAVYFDEPSMDKAGVESLVNNFNSKVTARGLPLKPIAINFTESQILNGTGYQATNIDYVGLEAYVDPSLQNDSNLINILNGKIDQQKAIIGNRPMFIVIQGYDRNGAWTNLESLKSIQVPAYLKSYNDPRMIGLFIFSYARPGGTRELHSCIRNEHLHIWGAISGTTQPNSISCSGVMPLPSPTPPSGCSDNAATALISGLSGNLIPGNAYPMTIRVTDTGNTRWYHGSVYQFAQRSSLILNPTYGHLPLGKYPGDTTDWTFTLTAPSVPGSYTLNMQMIHYAGGQYIQADGTTCPAPSSDTYFGQQFVLNLVVANIGSPSPSPSPSPSASPSPLPSPSPSLSLSPSPPPSPSSPPSPRPSSSGLPGPQSIFDSLTLQSVPKILSGLACYFVRFALILVGIAVILAGIIFILARGNPTAFADAKKNLLYVIIGGLVIYGVYTIILSVSLIVTGSTNLPWIPLTCS